MPGIKQNPRGGWLDGEGDFYFFPRHLLPPKQLEEFETLATVRGTPDMPAGKASTQEPGSNSLAWLWMGAGVAAPLVAGTVTLAVRRRRRKAQRGESTRLVPVEGPLVCLYVVGSHFAYQSVPGASRITVGRQRRKPDQAADEGNDLVVRLPDESGGTLRISRRQMEIERVGEQYFVTDRSSHGTRLNGEPLVKDQRTPLKSADRLNLSDVVTLEVQIRTNQLGGTVAPSVQAPIADGRPQPLVIEASVGDMQTI